MEKPNTITVLCSTYNSSKWIEGYLDSINRQLLPKFNIIFVDANSTDDSLNKIENFKFRDGITCEIIKCKERIPIYEAWNIAINKSNSPYVVNVNTDDQIFPAALLTYEAYTKLIPEADVIYGSYRITTNPTHIQTQGVKIPLPLCHDKLLKECYIGPFPLLKRDTIIEQGMFNTKYTISGDYEMWLRMSYNGKVFHRIEEFIGSYYHNPEGMSTNRESKHWQEHVRQDLEIREIYK